MKARVYELKNNKAKSSLVLKGKSGKQLIIKSGKKVALDEKEYADFAKAVKGFNHYIELKIVEKKAKATKPQEPVVETAPETPVVEDSSPEAPAELAKASKKVTKKKATRTGRKVAKKKTTTRRK